MRAIAFSLLLGALAAGAALGQELAVEIRAVGGAPVAGATVCAGTLVDACRFARARTGASGIALLPGIAPGWTSVTAQAPGHVPVERRLLAHGNIAPLRLVLTPAGFVPGPSPGGIKPAVLAIELGDMIASEHDTLIEIAWRATIPVTTFCVATAPHVRHFESWRHCFAVTPRDRHRSRVPLRSPSGNAVLVPGQRARLCLRVATWDRLVSEPACATLAYRGPVRRLHR